MFGEKFFFELFFSRSDNISIILFLYLLSVKFVISIFIHGLGVFGEARASSISGKNLSSPEISTD